MRQYPYAVGRVRVMETRLLDRPKLERLLEAKNEEDVWRSLAETPYAGGANAGNHYEEEIIFQNRRKEVSDFLLKFAGEDPLVKVFLWRDDLHNLKVCVKAETMKKDLRHLFLETGYFSVSLIKTAWERKTNDLPFWILKAVSEARKGLEEKLTSQEIDLTLDRCYFEEATRIISAVGSPIYVEIWKKTIDTNNFRNLVRSRIMKLTATQWEKVYIPGGTYSARTFQQLLELDDEMLSQWMENSTFAGLLKDDEKILNSLPRLEAAIDNYIYALWYEQKADPFMPSALIAYYLAVEQEVKMVRLILAAKRNGLSGEHLRERIRHVGI